MTRLSRLLDAIAPPSAGGRQEAQRHVDSLTKPPGSLGRLEEIALRLALLSGHAPGVTHPVVFTSAADHGGVAEGVRAYPPAVPGPGVDSLRRGGAAASAPAR